MLTGQNIICFAKDFNEDPTSNNHVIRQLAKSNRVLWLNSISMRIPVLSSGRDLKKIKNKLANVFQGEKKVEENLWVYTPLVLPLPHSKFARSLNLHLLKISLGIMRRKLRMHDFQLWTFLPNVTDYVGNLGESLVVYYCVDEWSGFSYLDGARMAETEKLLCQKADIVFVTAQTLLENKAAFNPETHLATHGVDHALFARALDERTALPPDLAALPQPVLGFYGTIQDWIDIELLAYLAERHPEWTIALIGAVYVDVSHLEKYPNIHFLGRKPHAQLPDYCKGFAVGLIPYLLIERMRYVNPLKLREYLCSGLPIVSTAVPEVLQYKKWCYIAADIAEFERCIEMALRCDTPEIRKQRSEAMRDETWQRKVEAVGTQVMRVKESKCQQTKNIASV